MNHQYGRPPMTPKFNKRIAPIAPAGAPKSTNKAPRHVRQPQTAIWYSSPKCCTPSSTAGTPDRFIPNRARTDVAKARRALLSPQQKDDENNGRQHEYHRRLRQALWGNSDDEGSLLAFGTTVKRQEPSDSPYRQNILRSPIVDFSSNSSVKTTRRTFIAQEFSVQVMDMLQFDDLNLISYGPLLAVALDDEVYLRKKDGSVGVLTNKPGEMITCVRWSGDHKLLAIGLECTVQIWSLEDKKFVKEFLQFGSFVTAFAWNGQQLIAGSTDGLLRYDLEQENSRKARYEGHGREVAVTSLVFNQNTIASAGGGSINIWDTNQYGREPIRAKHTLLHPGVRVLTFCPGNPSMLISGGYDGIIIWNSQNGAQRSTINMEARVRAMVWSPFTNNEVLVAHEHSLSLWTMGSKATKIVERATGEGLIISMDRYLDGQVVLAHDNEMLTGYSVFQKSHKSRKSLWEGTGKLSAPVIR